LKNDSKELHCLPSEEISKIKKDSSTLLNITIMHHNAEGFELSSKIEPDSSISSGTSILFLVHEHIIGTYNHSSKK